jgi:hypothetical protein
VRLYDMRKGRNSGAPPKPVKHDPERTPTGRPSQRPKRHDSEPSLSKLFGKLFKK